MAFKNLYPIVVLMQKCYPDYMDARLRKICSNVVQTVCIAILSGCNVSDDVKEREGDAQSLPVTDDSQKQTRSQKGITSPSEYNQDTIDDLIKQASGLVKTVEGDLRNKYAQEPILGIINKSFYDKIVELLPNENLDLLISSPGGETHYALLSAQLISESDHTISILGMCSSSCSEYLLPAASSVKFIGDPLIGFHGNPMATAAKVRAMSKNKAKPCMPDNNHVRRMEKLYEKHGINPDFWKLQYEHLVVKSTSINEVSIPLSPKFQAYKDQGINIENSLENCSVTKTITQHTMWYPTSKQLRKDFGLKFTGSVCADDYKCYAPRLTKISKKGTSYAVGDTVFIVGETSNLKK